MSVKPDLFIRIVIPASVALGAFAFTYALITQVKRDRAYTAAVLSSAGACDLNGGAERIFNAIGAGGTPLLLCHDGSVRWKTKTTKENNHAAP